MRFIVIVIAIDFFIGYSYPKKSNLSKIGFGFMAIEISELSDEFNNIYKKNLWVNGSGTGSGLKVTRGYRKFLAKFFKKRQIKSVVDFGCGDWQFSKEIDWSGIDYKGFDVADYVLERNRQNYRGGGGIL